MSEDRTPYGRPDDHYVDASDFFIERGEGGEILPVDFYLEGWNKYIAIVPMTQTEIKRFRRQIGDSEFVPSWLQADLLKRHVHRPELNVTADDLDENMLGFAPARLLEAIFEVSGFRGKVEAEGGRVRVSFDEKN